MSEKYEMYHIVAQRGNDIVEFRVRGTSHTQHIWSETHIDGLAKSAEDKIHQLKQAGYRVYTEVGGRQVRVVN